MLIYTFPLPDLLPNLETSKLSCLGVQAPPQWPVPLLALLPAPRPRPPRPQPRWAAAQQQQLFWLAPTAPNGTKQRRKWRKHWEDLGSIHFIFISESRSPVLKRERQPFAESRNQLWDLVVAMDGCNATTCAQKRMQYPVPNGSLISFIVRTNLS